MELTQWTLLVVERVTLVWQGFSEFCSFWSCSVEPYTSVACVCVLSDRCTRVAECTVCTPSFVCV